MVNIRLVVVTSLSCPLTSGESDRSSCCVMVIGASIALLYTSIAIEASWTGGKVLYALTKAMDGLVSKTFMMPPMLQVEGGA